MATKSAAKTAKTTSKTKARTAKTSTRGSYSFGRDVGAGELKDRRGRVVDDKYVQEALADPATKAALRKARSRGRPSLSEAGESPLLRIRLPHDLDAAITRAARKAGRSRPDWVRQVLAEATR
jgi:hypothetical protein